MDINKDTSSTYFQNLHSILMAMVYGLLGLIIYNWMAGKVDLSNPPASMIWATLHIGFFWFLSYFPKRRIAKIWFVFPRFKYKAALANISLFIMQLMVGVFLSIYFDFFMLTGPDDDVFRNLLVCYLVFSLALIAYPSLSLERVNDCSGFD